MNIENIILLILFIIMVVIICYCNRKHLFNNKNNSTINLISNEDTSAEKLKQDKIYNDAQRFYREELKQKRIKRIQDERKKAEKYWKEKHAAEMFEVSERKRITGKLIDPQHVEVNIINTNDTPESYIVGVETEHETITKEIHFMPGNTKRTIDLWPTIDIGKCKIFYENIMHYENNLPLCVKGKRYYSDIIYIECEELPWQEVNDNPSLYLTELFHIKGYVYQIIDDNLLVSTYNRKYNPICITNYKKKTSKNINVNSYIEIYGYCDGKYYYKSTDNNIISIPKIDTLCEKY